MKLYKSSMFQSMIMVFMMAMSVTAFSADNLTFKGNLKIPNCVINNNNTVEVDFGDIEIQTLPVVNRMYHGRNFDIQINCPYNLGTPSLTITSSEIANNSAGILKTSKYSAGGLSLVLRKKDGTEMINFGSPVDITNSITSISATQKTLTLYTALSRATGSSLSDLTPGPFTASANMVLKYQ